MSLYWSVRLVLTFCWRQIVCLLCSCVLKYLPLGAKILVLEINRYKLANVFEKLCALFVFQLFKT
jgi:hypothetical protein